MIKHSTFEFTGSILNINFKVTYCFSLFAAKGGGWSKALLALFACHPKFLASAKLFAVPKVPKVPNF